MAEGSPSRIPTPVSSLKRSTSLRVRGERPIVMYSTSPTPFPSIAEREESTFLTRTPIRPRRNLELRSRSQASGLNGRDDDLESVDSFSSQISNFSTRSNCEHSLFAKNGTTFSARSNKYVVHCSDHCHTPEEYLTPTQRANRNVRRLKTLLQLAREKLTEKEKEIFKLTKEVVELKVFKASVKNNFSEASTPSDCQGISDGIDGPATYTVDEVREFPCDTPEKQNCSCFEEDEKPEASTSSPHHDKRSPHSPFHPCLRDNYTATPDYLLSSLADSGHFDDLASTFSMQSKDSINMHIPMEEPPEVDDVSSEADKERARLVAMYENLLRDSKVAQENEIRSVKLANEENNMKMVDNFEVKLKTAESEFERKFNDLIKSTEHEKMEIVDRFERRLEEERLKFNGRVDNGVQTEMLTSDSYMEKVEEEKAKFENSLAEIKRNFEVERDSIEKHFDDAMQSERRKFEEVSLKIQSDYDTDIKHIVEKRTLLEKEYKELAQKYNDSLELVRKLEEENTQLKCSLQDQDSRQKEMYLKMFLKGQEAVQFQQDDETTETAQASKPSVLPTPELLVQLKVTEVELENLKDKEYRAQNSDHQGISLISAKEALSLWMLAARKAMYKRLYDSQNRPFSECEPSTSTAAETASAAPKSTQNSAEDPEATLQFLKSAVYYFLTDRDKHLEHLRAIESILGFSQQERRDIETHYVHP